MNGQDGHDPFGGQNKASAILVTLVIASFAVCTLYIAYRQLNRCLEGRGSLDPPLTISASTIALGQRPILSDVHIQKEKVGWRGWKVSKFPSRHPCDLRCLVPSLMTLAFDDRMCINGFFCPA